MSKSQNELDELKTLQREAAELRAERKRSVQAASSKARRRPEKEEPHQEAAPPAEEQEGEQKTPQKARRKRSRSTAASAGTKNSATTEIPQGADPPSSDTAEEDPSPDTDHTLRDLAVQIEDAMKGMEEAAKEHPALALLAAFTVGIVVGQLVARR